MPSTTSSKTEPRRGTGARRSEPGLDIYRGLAVLLMFAVHAYRLEPGQAVRGAGERALAALSWAEPYIAASFLFVVGMSLVLSREHTSAAPRRWLVRLGRRALGLYALSLLLFITHYGFELPDLLVSSGILSAIALAIIVTGACLAVGRSALWLAGASIVVVGATAWLDRAHVTVPGMNGGPGGAFPLLAFSCWGALACQAYRRRGARALGALAAGGAVVCVAVLASRAPWTTLQTSHYADHGGEVALLDLAKSGARAVEPVVFWNHSAVGALGLAFPLLATAWLLVASGARLSALRALFPLELVGRHALGAYVMHLGLLGVLDLAGAVPPDAAWTWALISGLFALAVLLSMMLERHAPAAPVHSSASVAR